MAFGERKVCAKNQLDPSSRLATIHGCPGRTDRQTDRRPDDNDSVDRYIGRLKTHHVDVFFIETDSPLTCITTSNFTLYLLIRQS